MTGTGVGGEPAGVVLSRTGLALIGHQSQHEADQRLEV